MAFQIDTSNSNTITYITDELGFTILDSIMIIPRKGVQDGRLRQAAGNHTDRSNQPEVRALYEQCRPGSIATQPQLRFIQ